MLKKQLQKRLHKFRNLSYQVLKGETEGAQTTSPRSLLHVFKEDLRGRKIFK